MLFSVEAFIQISGKLQVIYLNRAFAQKRNISKQ